MRSVVQGVTSLWNRLVAFSARGRCRRRSAHGKDLAPPNLDMRGKVGVIRAFWGGGTGRSTSGRRGSLSTLSPGGFLAMT
jgi:hypothetical protein